MNNVELISRFVIDSRHYQGATIKNISKLFATNLFITNLFITLNTNFAQELPYIV